jgi:hypothetical protein
VTLFTAAADKAWRAQANRFAIPARDPKTVEVRSQYPHTRQYRTWYGMTGTVTLKSELMHKTGFGIFVVSHPAAVNWLLRKGLPEADGIALSQRHEFGHLQTLPLLLIYVGALVVMSADLSPWMRIPAVLISSQAAWEMMAEFLTWAGGVRFYRARYAKAGRLPRIIFWLLAGLMTSGGTFLLATS